MGHFLEILRYDKWDILSSESFSGTEPLSRTGCARKTLQSLFLLQDIILVLASRPAPRNPILDPRSPSVSMASSGMVRHGMVRHGMVQNGMVENGMALQGEVWHGMVWFGVYQ